MPNRIAHDNDYPVIDESNRLYQRALGLIPSATQTLAKGPGQYVKGVAPTYLTHGRGSHVWDADGNEYIDFTMAVGPLSLGYANEVVDDAIRAQLASGITFSLMHPLEVEVAEMIREIVPNAEMVRYSKSGADVTSAAVRLARAWTKRDRVLCCGYHGWHDWYIGVTDRSSGVPEGVRELTSTFAYNDIESLLESIDYQTACVILEPMVFDEPRDGFLEKLREACTAHGVVLVFDEMWTGFRIALGGAQQHFGVYADLACFSKAVANGMPLSILTGRGDIMSLLERDVFFYTTFGGEALSLAAAKATITEMRSRNVPKELGRTGALLKDGYNRTAEQLGMGYTRCKGLPQRTIVEFDADAGDPLLMKSYIQQEMIRHGILWSGFHNVSFAHSQEDVDHTLEAYAEVLSLLRDAIAAGDIAMRLRGAPIEPVFRRTANFNTKPVRS